MLGDTARPSPDDSVPSGAHAVRSTDVWTRPPSNKSADVATGAGSRSVQSPRISTRSRTLTGVVSRRTHGPRG